MAPKTASLPPQFDCAGCRDRMRLSDQCGECLLCRRGCCKCREQEWRLAPDGDRYTVDVATVRECLSVDGEDHAVQQVNACRDLYKYATELAQLTDAGSKLDREELYAVEAANILLRRVLTHRKLRRRPR